MKLRKRVGDEAVNPEILRRKLRSGLIWLGFAPPEGPPALEPKHLERITSFTLALAELGMRPPPRVLNKDMPKRVVMFVVSQLRIDPRVEREARALASLGYEVVVIAPDLSEPRHAQSPLDWGKNVSFDLLPFEGASFVMEGPWFYSTPMVETGLKHEAFAFHAHDLWTAFIALECASQTGSLAVMDFHEWTSENVHWDASDKKWAALPSERADAFRNLEKLSMRMAALTITVNHSIARALEKMAGIAANSVQVVRNIPALDLTPTRPYPPLKAQFAIPEDRPVVLYQGGTGPSRLLEPIIESLAFAPDLMFIIRGPSLDMFGEGYRAVAARAGVADRIILADGVPSRDVVAAARGADAGVWTLPDLSKNFRLALPNKIFEYLAAGLPIAVADYPEAARIVNEYGCGATFDPNDPKSIADALSALVGDPQRRKAAADRVAVALHGLQADREWEKFAELYENLWLKRALDQEKRLG